MCAALTLLDRMAVPVYATEKKSRTVAGSFKGGIHDYLRSLRRSKRLSAEGN